MPHANFIILSDSRSGSTLLMGLLNSHGQIRCEGELFHPGEPAKIFWRAISSRETASEELALRDSDPGEFLEQCVFPSGAQDEWATGFKIFYDHATLEEWKAVWPYLRDCQELKVIHLVRRNQLARIVSNKIAITTNKWFSLNDGEGERDLKVEIPVGTCQEEFERAAEKRAEFNEYFASHPILELAYEELAEDKNRTCSKILRFLGVEDRVLRTGLKKQNTRKLSECLSNFAALKEHFTGTAWAKYFGEN